MTKMNIKMSLKFIKKKIQELTMLGNKTLKRKRWEKIWHKMRYRDGLIANALKTSLALIMQMKPIQSFKLKTRMNSIVAQLTRIVLTSKMMIKLP